MKEKQPVFMTRVGGSRWMEVGRLAVDKVTACGTEAVEKRTPASMATSKKKG